MYMQSGRILKLDAPYVIYLMEYTCLKAPLLYSHALDHEIQCV